MAAEEETNLRAAGQDVVFEHQWYGYRRVAAELRQRGMIKHARYCWLMLTEGYLRRRLFRQTGLVGGHESALGTPQSRPMARPDGKFFV